MNQKYEAARDVLLSLGVGEKTDVEAKRTLLSLAILADAASDSGHQSDDVCVEFVLCMLEPQKFLYTVIHISFLIISYLAILLTQHTDCKRVAATRSSGRN